VFFTGRILLIMQGDSTHHGPQYTIKASRKLTSSAVGFVGEIVAIPFTTVPAGFLECDGQAISRDDYPDLYNTITDLYGLGTTINTFKVPDYRGYALRALDNGAGIDPNRVIGSKQEDMFKTHFHIVPRNHHTPSGIDSIGAGFESGGTPDNDGLSDGGYPYKTVRNSDGGGSETRMKNVAVKFIIRALPLHDSQAGINTFQVCDDDGANCFEPNEITQLLTQMSLITTDVSGLKIRMGNVETQISSLESWHTTIETEVNDLSSRGETWNEEYVGTKTKMLQDIVILQSTLDDVQTDVDIIAASVNELVPENLKNTDNTLTQQQRQIDILMAWILVITLVMAVRLILDVMTYFKKEISSKAIEPCRYHPPDNEETKWTAAPVVVLQATEV
jgi:hypothetical protein